MADDERVSRSPLSGFATIDPNDGNVNEVLDLRSSETMAPDYLKVGYEGSGTNETMVTISDRSADEGTFGSEGEFERVFLSPGETVVITEASYDDLSNGVSAQTDGNNDARVVVTIGGMKVTG